MTKTVRERAETRRSRVAAPRPMEVRVLLATAGEPESRGAATVAAAIAKRYHAPVLALGVVTPFPHNLSTITSMRHPVALDETSRLEVLEAVRQAVHQFSAGEWETRAVIGDPASTIDDLARQWGATLIVTGLGRHKRVDRIFGSETAIAVMKHSTIPVLAVPARMSGLPERAVAAIDFTAPSMETWSSSIARVRAPSWNWPSATCAATPSGVSIQRCSRASPVAPSLNTHDASTASSLRLEGMNEGSSTSIVLGSVRTRVVRDARCAVLVAPAPAAQ